MQPSIFKGSGQVQGRAQRAVGGYPKRGFSIFGGRVLAGQAKFLTVSVENSEGVRNKTPGATTLRVLAPFGMEFSGRESLRTHASIYKPHAMKKASNEGPCSALAEVRTHSPRPELAASKVQTCCLRSVGDPPVVGLWSIHGRLHYPGL